MTTTDRDVFDAFLDRVRLNSAVVNQLPGGVINGRRVTEISRQSTPAAYDANRELQACALVRMETAVPVGRSNAMRAVLMPIAITLYHPTSYDVLDEVAAQLYDELHDQVLTAVNVLSMVETERLPTRTDEILEAPSKVLRYGITFLRA